MVRRGSAKPQMLVQIQSVTLNLRLAQLGERLRDMQKATGSSPVSPTKKCQCRIVVDCTRLVSGIFKTSGVRIPPLAQICSCRIIGDYTTLVRLRFKFDSGLLLEKIYRCEQMW